MRLRSLFALLIALPLAACGETIGTYHFRLTVDIDTPEGIRSGSSVLAVTYGHALSMNGGGQSAFAHFQGEAVFVDLGKGRNVVALLAHGAFAQASDVIEWLPVSALTGTAGGWSTTQALPVPGSKLEGKAELKPPYVPTLVTFSDLNDPKSVKVIYATGVEIIPVRDPQGRIVHNKAGAAIVAVDKFVETFGFGYRFRRAAIEMVPVREWRLSSFGYVGEAVTRGIEKKMPWLAKMRADKLIGVIDTYPGRFTINAPYFIRGF